jgi:hypothetical protein
MADLTYLDMTEEHLGDTATADDLAAFVAACATYQEQTDCTDAEATDYVWDGGSWYSRVNVATPGPWHVQTKTIHSELSGKPFNVYAITSRDDYDEYIETHRVSGIEPDAWKMVTQDIRENEANARLIASAPELLEALEEYDLFSRQNDNWSDGDEFDVPEFVLKARAAIAKAKGGN